MRFVNDFLFASKKEKVLTSDQRDWIGIVYKIQDLSSRLGLKYDQVKKIGQRYDSKQVFLSFLFFSGDTTVVWNSAFEKIPKITD